MIIIFLYRVSEYDIFKRIVPIITTKHVGQCIKIKVWTLVTHDATRYVLTDVCKLSIVIYICCTVPVRVAYALFYYTYLISMLIHLPISHCNPVHPDMHSHAPETLQLPPL